MSEVNGKTLSISFRIDEGVIEHNNRIFIAKNVDGERVQDNITYCRQDIREAYIRPHSLLRENSWGQLYRYYHQSAEGAGTCQERREAYLIKAPAYPHKTEKPPRSCYGFGVANFVCPWILSVRIGGAISR